MKIKKLIYLIAFLASVRPCVSADERSSCLDTLAAENDYVAFFYCFPESNSDFKYFYGCNTNDGASPLYEKARHQILDCLIEAKKYVPQSKYYSKISKLASDIHYDVDAPFYFRELFLKLLSTDQNFDTFLSKLDVEQRKKIAIFITSSVLGSHTVIPKCMPSSKFCAQLILEKFNKNASKWVGE